MRLGAQVETRRVSAGEGAGHHRAEVADAAQRGLQGGVMAAVFDAHVGAAARRGQADLLAGVAGGGVERQVRTQLARHLAAQRDRVDGNHRMRPRQPHELQHQQADRAHPEHGHRVADAHVAVAHRAEREVGRIEAGCGLPGNALGKHAYAVRRPHVFLAEPAVREHSISGPHCRDRAACLDHLADAYVPQPGREKLPAAGFPVTGSAVTGPAGKDAQLAVVTAARQPVTLVQGHFGTVLGGPELAAHPNLVRRQRLARIVAERDPLACRRDQFSWHGDDTIAVGTEGSRRASRALVRGDHRAVPPCALMVGPRRRLLRFEAVQGDLRQGEAVAGSGDPIGKEAVAALLL